MSQRESGYARIERDAYQTPPWVTEAVVPWLRKRALHIWEPACGERQMSDTLTAAGFKVDATDIEDGLDFLQTLLVDPCIQAIVTNPPYALASEFIEHALKLMQREDGVVAMLLRTDFDHAAGRRFLFADCPAFCQKLVLTKRIVWFEGDGKVAAPSFNHAWYMWDWKHKGPPTIAYGP